MDHSVVRRHLVLNRLGFVEARLLGSDLGEDRGFTVVRRRLGCPVGGLELDWWDEADLAVEASPVDVFGDCDFDVADGLLAAVRAHGRRVADALGLEQRVERWPTGWLD